MVNTEHAAFDIERETQQSFARLFSTFSRSFRLIVSVLSEMREGFFFGQELETYTGLCS